MVCIFDLCSKNNFYLDWKLIIFFLRKFLAAVILGLHVTPGRRLRPTMEKLKARSRSDNQPDSFEEALLNLLKNSNWSNSLQDLAMSLKAFEDNDPCVMRNVDKLLCSLLEKLAWSDDYKLRDMAHRQELKFVINYGEGGCVHQRPSVVKHRCIQFSLRIPTRSRELMTAEQVEGTLDGLLKCQVTENCEQCGTRAARSCFLSIEHGCDPDFLTVVCDAPICFRSNDLTFLTVTFSKSVYRVMAAVHWDTDSKKSSVSRVRNDGEWWWHGVVEGQAESFKYSPAQVNASRHLQDASVLMMVRVDGDRDRQADAVEDGDQQDNQIGESVTGAATAEHENRYVDGQSVAGETALGDCENFNPLQTSTQRDGSKMGAEDASSGSGKRPGFSTGAGANYETGTQVGQKYLQGF